MSTQDTTLPADERAAFEAWAQSKGYCTDYGHGSYLGHGVEDAWEGWKAAIAAQAQQPDEFAQGPTPEQIRDEHVAQQAQGVPEAAEHARRLAEDWAEDCIKAGYVTTGAQSHKRMKGAIEALAAAPQAEPQPERKLLGYLSEHTFPESSPYHWQFKKTSEGVYRDNALRVLAVYEDGSAEPQTSCQGCQTPRACQYNGCAAEHAKAEPQQAEPLSLIAKAELIRNWFAEEWAQKAAMGLLADYDLEIGIGTKGGE